MSMTPNGDPGNDVKEASQENHVNFLVVGADLGFAKSVQSAFQAVASNNPGKNYRVFPGGTKEKLLEYLEKQTLHSILIEEEVLTDRTSAHYLAEMKELCKKNLANAAVPFIFVTSKTDLAKTMNLVREGWMDVVIKPLDPSLFVQKMNIYNPAVPVIGESLLFSMDCEKDIDLSFRYKTKTISEYGMHIVMAKPVDVGTVLYVSGAMLPQPISASVLECKKIGDNEHHVHLLFVGITAAETQSIRKLIRQQYAEVKQAA